VKTPTLILTAVAIRLLPSVANMTAYAQGWPGYAHDPQHSTLSTTPSQLPQLVRWSTPVDLNPQYSGSDLHIHYGAPVITAANTVILPVKTGATSGFEVDAHSASNGALLWTLPTDYAVPNHNWFPICGVTLTPNDAAVAFPGAGGTIYVRPSPDSASGVPTRMAFYGLANYVANQAAYNVAIQICTPISSDGLGNLYFGYVSTGAALPGYPSGIPSGLARISSSGAGIFVSAAAICGDNSMQKVCYNCAPAFSNDGTTLYVAVNNGTSGKGYLCALHSTTLARQSSVFLLDPRSTPSSPLAALVTDDSSASPTVGPDGDVYYGVLEGNSPSNNDRGWLLHFSGDLGTTKLPGAFGWDDTASVVPVSAVPSYTGSASYLLLTKYNNYAGMGSGDGVNRLALVDPNTSFVDPISGATVMNPFITVKGVTPDPEYDQTYPNAVREWCINSAAVDPINKCAVVNSEDGNLYRWDFTKATDTPGQLSPALYLAPPTGEAYTPTSVGPDGSVYAINNATLFSIDPKLLQAVLDNANHVLTFTYVRAQADTTYSVQTSTDLASWTTAGVNQGSGAVGQIVTASISLGTETKRFVRLEETTNPSSNHARRQDGKKPRAFSSCDCGK
jgi:hypothetical protein